MFSGGKTLVSVDGKGLLKLDNVTILLVVNLKPQ